MIHLEKNLGKSLSSQAEYVAEPRRSQTEDVHTHERLVVGKHCMHRMHIRPEDTNKLYLERFRNNNWDEKEKCDEEFHELEGELWKKMFPKYANVEKEEEGVDGDKCEEKKIVDDKESEPGAGGGEHGVIDLFGADSDSDDVNHKNLKLPGVCVSLTSGAGQRALMTRSQQGRAFEPRPINRKT